MKGRDTKKRKSARRWGIAAPFLGILAYIGGAKAGKAVGPDFFRELFPETRVEVIAPSDENKVADYNCADIDSNPVESNSSNLDAVVRDANGIPDYTCLSYSVPTEAEANLGRSNSVDLEGVIRDANSVAEPNKPAIKQTAEASKKPLIIIDPGHGMNNAEERVNDPGCIANGINERDVVSKIANMTAVFCQQMGFDVEMTRYDNKTGMHINNRAKFIDERNPAAALILHADSGVESARGPTGVYRPSSTKETESIALEKSILTELANIDPSYATSSRGTKTEIDATGHTLGVLDANEVNAYMELGFLTNPLDKTILMDRAYEVAKALAIGTAKDVLARNPELKNKIRTEIPVPDFSYLEVYRAGVEELTRMFNEKHGQNRDPNSFLAQIHVETGSERERENSFKYDPLQIANARKKGHSLLEVLSEGAENSGLIGDFSSLRGKTKARWDENKKQWDYSQTGMTAEASLLGGIGGAYFRAAEFGEREVEIGEPNDYTIVSGDNPTKIAKKVGTTVETLRRYNKMDETNLQVESVLKYRETRTEKFISGLNWEGVYGRYNGDGDPLYAAKIEIACRQLKENKSQAN